MSDTMLLGVLRVPFDLAMSTTTAQIQYHQRGVQAADEIEKRTRERDEARAEIERQARHIEELREKIDAEGSCACSLDAPGDICAAHSPALMRARAEVERLRAERDTLLLDARDFLRWFNRNYPDPSGHPDHPWCAINLRLNAHADTLSALDSGLGAEP